MELKQLEYFVAVAELSSFTRASIALNIAQPALSRQVRALEVELRQNLLLRNGRGVTLTEAGAHFLEHARGIIHQVEHARESLHQLRGTLAGRVAVGFPPSLAKRLTVPLSRAFRAHLPQATLSITESLSSAMAHALVAGRLDIALLYNPPTSSDIDSVVIQEEELFLISAAGLGCPTAPITLADLSGIPLVIPTRPNAIRTIVELALAEIRCHPTIGMEIDGVAAILDLVQDGVGHAVLPLNAVMTAADPQVFQTRRIMGPTVRSRLALATSSQRPVSRTQLAVVELIRDLVVRSAAQGMKPPDVLDTTASESRPSE